MSPTTQFPSSSQVRPVSPSAAGHGPRAALRQRRRTRRFACSSAADSPRPRRVPRNPGSAIAARARRRKTAPATYLVVTRSMLWPVSSTSSASARTQICLISNLQICVSYGIEDSRMPVCLSGASLPSEAGFPKEISELHYSWSLFRRVVPQEPPACICSTNPGEGVWKEQEVLAPLVRRPAELRCFLHGERSMLFERWL